MADADAHSRFFLSSLSLSLSLLLFLFFSTDGSTIEKGNFFARALSLSSSLSFSFPMKYKHWIRIISFFNSSTWFTVCYSKGVSMYCSLSLSRSRSRSLLIAAVGSGIFKPTTAFVRSFLSYLAERNEEKERARERAREREYFLSLLLRQYAAIQCNCFFDWRIRPSLQPIIGIVEKEKFISIFYCLLFWQLTRSYRQP